MSQDLLTIKVRKSIELFYQRVTFPIVWLGQGIDGCAIVVGHDVAVVAGDYMFLFGRPYLETSFFYSFHRDQDDYLQSAAPDVIKALLLTPFEVRCACVQSVLSCSCSSLKFGSSIVDDRLSKKSTTKSPNCTKLCWIASKRAEATLSLHSAPLNCWLRSKSFDVLVVSLTPRPSMSVAWYHMSRYALCQTQARHESHAADWCLHVAVYTITRDA